MWISNKATEKCQWSKMAKGRLRTPYEFLKLSTEMYTSIQEFSTHSTSELRNEKPEVHSLNLVGRSTRDYGDDIRSKGPYYDYLTNLEEGEREIPWSSSYTFFCKPRIGKAEISYSGYCQNPQSNHRQHSNQRKQYRLNNNRDQQSQKRLNKCFNSEEI